MHIMYRMLLIYAAIISSCAFILFVCVFMLKNEQMGSYIFLEIILKNSDS